MLDMPIVLIAYGFFILVIGCVIVIVDLKENAKKTKIRHEWFLDEDNRGDK